MHNSDKSNEIYSQYIAKELLDALAVFLDSSENDEVVKNVIKEVEKEINKKDAICVFFKCMNNFVKHQYILYFYSLTGLF